MARACLSLWQELLLDRCDLVKQRGGLSRDFQRLKARGDKLSYTGVVLRYTGGAVIQKCGRGGGQQGSGNCSSGHSACNHQASTSSLYSCSYGPHQGCMKPAASDEPLLAG
ncbi:hypothetical protein ABBQ38_006765 [Trebouxia sp. C0009 RCD-2024]